MRGNILGLSLLLAGCASQPTQIQNPVKLESRMLDPAEVAQRVHSLASKRGTMSLPSNPSIEVSYTGINAGQRSYQINTMADNSYDDPFKTLAVIVREKDTEIMYLDGFRVSERYNSSLMGENFLIDGESLMPLDGVADTVYKMNNLANVCTISPRPSGETQQAYWSILQELDSRLTKGEGISLNKIVRASAENK